MQPNDDDRQYMKKKGKKEHIIYKSNPSSQLLVEDSLKIMLNKSKGIGYKKINNKYAPRNKHSVFGDFPKDFMTKKKQNFDLPPIDSHQVSSHTKFGFDNNSLSKKTRSNTTSKFIKPPISGAFFPRKIEVSSFRMHYDRGDLPIFIQHSGGYKIVWKGLDDKDEQLDTQKLSNYFSTFDFQLNLPIFVDGIRETTDPYRFLAIQGTFYLLDNIGDGILKVVSQLIIPLKKALNTRDPNIIIITLKVIQKLATCSKFVGPRLVPYYRQLLPILNVFITNNKNLGDKIDYGQRKKNTLGDLIQETLEILEQTGGDEAFINIKYMIPTYESCIYEIRA